jgi:hypothetical protein
VLLEIGNEVDLPNVFAHPIITAARCHELIELAKKRSQGKLLVSTSLVTLGSSEDRRDCRFSSSEVVLAAAIFMI